MDPNSLEAKLTLANLRICQSRSNEAIEIVRQYLSSWYTEAKQDNEDHDVAEEKKDSDIGENVLLMDGVNMPAYPQRVSIAKLCIELALYQEALDVLQTLLAENDEDMENWYLFGWTYYLMQDMSAAKECLTKASEVRTDETERH